jgi:DNA-binding XRE family transcriptional regulator
MFNDTDVGMKRRHMRLGAKIREARARVGHTQNALAGMLAVTRGAVCQWETGRAAPDRKRCMRLAVVLKLPLADLFDEEPALLAEPSGRRSPHPRVVNVASAFVALDAALLDKVRGTGIDIRAELTMHLRNLVAAARAERWLSEDHEAIGEANAILEQHGLLSSIDAEGGARES